mmetsp:Transcript_71693/g.184906  ORF Transcript_71693/g.184906 Transcript_71693/m.184906 type:complete len:458 (-) Transcript_71693:1229-2602(-)
MVALVDAGHAAQADLIVLLVLEFLQLLILQLLDLPVRVLLQLPHGLLVHVLGQLPLVHDALDVVLVRRLLLFELLLHPFHLHLVRPHDVVVLLLPVAVHSLPLREEFLIAANLDHHLVLERAFQVLRLLGVQLHEALLVLVGLHLRVVRRLAQELVLRSLLLDLAGVLLLELHHLLLVEALAMPELELDLVGELLHLALELQQLCLLLVEEGPGDQDLVGGRQNILLVALRHDTVLLPHVEDEEAAVLRATEEVVVVEGDTDSRARRRVARELVVIAVQRELVGADGAWRVRLGDGCEERLRGVGQHDLAERRAGLQRVLPLPAAHLLQHLVIADDVHRVGACGGIGVDDHAREGRPLQDEVLAHASALRQHVVLVHSAVHACGHQHGVVLSPGHRPHFVVVATERLNHLTGVGPVHLDGVRAHGCEVLPAVAEAHLAAGLDGDVLVGLHILHQQVH